MPAPVRNSVMNTIDTVINQNDHISSTCVRLLAAASRPRSIGIAYEIMVRTIIT